MKSSVLSTRYAVALADVAEQEGLLERVRAELLALGETVAEETEFRRLVYTAERSREEKKAFFRQLVERPSLSGPTARMLDYLVDKRRTGLLGAIAESYAREADARLGYTPARVTSAVPLKEEHKQKIQTQLQRLTGWRIRLAEEVDKSLIAGFHVHVQGKFFDGSFRGQIERIRETMTHGG